MSFLKCNPCVFVIEKDYEILLFSKSNGPLSIQVGNNVYYEENCGVVSSEKNYAKIRIPQAELNAEKKYSVVFRKTIDRKAYFSEFAEEQRVEFAFTPLTKTTDINIYMLADVHSSFKFAKESATYFGDALDLLILSGDIAEVEEEENFFEVANLISEITHGSLPVIFVRGNHDTRGKLAERFTDFFPSNHKNTYYTFEVGALCGVALDCGEDKYDDHEEYGGANIFEPFRRRETLFLKAATLPKNKLPFAICHINPAQNTLNKGDLFDIENDVYTEWNKELSRLGIKFMLCGHIHKTYILEKNSPDSLREHDYPVIIGSAFLREKGIWGTALTINEKTLTVRFTDSSRNVIQTHEIDLESGKLL